MTWTLENALFDCYSPLDVTFRSVVKVYVERKGWGVESFCRRMPYRAEELRKFFSDEEGTTIEIFSNEDFIASKMDTFMSILQIVVVPHDSLLFHFLIGLAYQEILRHKPKDSDYFQLKYVSKTEGN